MKKTSTLKSLYAAVAITCCSLASQAATITATVSGNWSSASTWSGGTPGTSITTDNVVIPAGISVTMDIDIQFSSLLSSLSVNGSLIGTTTNSLTINSFSNLSGNGTLNLQYLELGTAGGMSFTGNATVRQFVTSATSLNLASQVMVMDTIYLKAGSLSLGTGANLSMNANSNIKVNDGSLTTGGGLFSATSIYNVTYVGGSKTAGLELSGGGLTGMTINLSSNSDNLTLSSNMMITGNLNHKMGTLVLNGKTLTLKGDYMSMNNAMISGSSSSNLIIQSSASLSSALMFNSGSRSLHNLEIDMTSAGNVNLNSDLAIVGDLKLMKGNLAVANNATLTMSAGSGIIRKDGEIMTSGGAMFNGSASYNVTYMGSSKMASVELSGSGLNDVMLQMTNANDSIRLAANTSVKGMMDLTKGSLSLNNKTLTLQGSFSSSANGWLQANGGSSNLMINTSGNLGDTLMFATNMNRLNNLTINIANSTNAMIGSALYVETITLTSGGITIMDKDLTVNATGSISGYSTSKYVQINGTGSLVMNVNSPSAYVMYPVGTASSMAAAYIQRNSGSGMIGVNTRNGVWTMGTSGNNNALTESVVNRTWDIKSVSSGSVDLNVKFEWTTAMEVNGFDRNHAYISHYSNNMWDVKTASTASVVSAGVYQMSRTNVTSLSPFAVVDENAEVSIDESALAVASLFPNPTAGKLYISVPGASAFKTEVYDSVGNLIISGAAGNGDSGVIDMSSLSSGVYFVKISNDQVQSVKRVVKH